MSTLADEITRATGIGPVAVGEILAAADRGLSSDEITRATGIGPVAVGEILAARERLTFGGILPILVGTLDFVDAYGEPIREHGAIYWHDGSWCLTRVYVDTGDIYGDTYACADVATLLMVWGADALEHGAREITEPDLTPTA